MELKNAVLRCVLVLLFFIVTAGTAAFLIGNLWYLLLFSSIGTVAGITELFIALKPRYSQRIRKAVLISLGLSLAALALMVGISFQFSQVCFDLYSGVVTGAVIQLLIARIFFPFIMGSSFCSRACWDSLVFEFADKNRNGTPSSSKLSAWTFTAVLIIVTAVVSIFFIPVPGTGVTRIFFAAENLAIITVGLIFAKFAGRRAYCRKLCPFLAISGVAARFSLFKITPRSDKECIACGRCDRECPMGIEVQKYVEAGKRINHPDCIVCEKCVNVCPNSCLILSVPFTGAHTNCSEN